MITENLSQVVRLGEKSQLKTDLNTAIAALSFASESGYRPHVCLNGSKGVEVLHKITAHSNTEIFILPNLIVSSGDVWLNVKFTVFLDRLTRPTNVADLSPRQSAYVLQNLPVESQIEMLAKVKKWYLEKFLADIQKGFATITKQFENGDPLLASDRDNRIFDIHGERPYGDVPYTECEVVGKELFWAVFYGRTILEAGRDGFAQSDWLINSIYERQKKAAKDVLGVMRTITPPLR